MPRAVLRDGVIHLLDPLPAEWQEGHELWVEAVEAPPMSPEESEQWWREFDELCAQSDPDEARRLQEILAEIRREARGMVRRGAGLP